MDARRVLVGITLVLPQQVAQHATPALTPAQTQVAALAVAVASNSIACTRMLCYAKANVDLADTTGTAPLRHGRALVLA